MRRIAIFSIGYVILAHSALAEASPAQRADAPATSSTAKEENSWDTDFGRMHFTIAPDGSVSGEYPKYSGMIKGQVTKDGLIEAIWVQPSSKQRCETEKEGSYHWGRVTWKVLEAKYLRGGWAYCDNPLGSGGAWNGDKPSVGKAFATLFSGLIKIAGRVAGSQIGGGIGGSIAGMAINQATGTVSSAVENAQSQPGSVTAAEPLPDYPSPNRR